MEVASTSNLVSSVSEKKTIACNFQTIAINSFVIAHDMMGDQMRTYVYLLISSYCFMMAEL